MATKLITIILYTLISVNFFALIFGGLVTWLGYSIPIRLRQFGLSPELAQLAGFCALLIGCLGLSALNFSSHHALNAYGLSCALFILFMLFGAVPEKWRHLIREQQRSTLQQQLLHANYTSTLLGGRPRGSLAGSSLALDLIYCALLLIFALLLVFALAFAHHLRRLERRQAAGASRDQLAELRADETTAGNFCDFAAHTCTCNGLGATEAQQPATVAPVASNQANILGSLPNLNRAGAGAEGEELAAPLPAGKCSSLSQSLLNGRCMRPIQQPPGALTDQLRHDPSFRSLVSLDVDQNLGEGGGGGGGGGDDDDDDDGDHRGRRWRRQVGLPDNRPVTPPPPPLVHQGFYYTATMQDGATGANRRWLNDSNRAEQAQQHCQETAAAKFRDPARYPQVNNSYRRAQARQPQHSQQAAARCRCQPGGVSALTASLRADLAEQQQQQQEQRRRQLAAMRALNQHAHARGHAHGLHALAKQKRAKPPGGASVMAMTAAAAAALFGGVVDAGPLDGTGAGPTGAGDADELDGMFDSNLDGCGAAPEFAHDFAHLQPGAQHGTSGAGHDPQQHDCRPGLAGHHQLPLDPNGLLLNRPVWDYGPMMSR